MAGGWSDVDAHIGNKHIGLAGRLGAKVVARDSDSRVLLLSLPKAERFNTKCSVKMVVF